MEIPAQIDSVGKGRETDGKEKMKFGRGGDRDGGTESDWEADEEEEEEEEEGRRRRRRRERNRDVPCPPGRMEGVSSSPSIS